MIKYIVKTTDNPADTLYFCCWQRQLPVLAADPAEAMEFTSKPMADMTAIRLDVIRGTAFKDAKPIFAAEEE